MKNYLDLVTDSIHPYKTTFVPNQVASHKLDALSFLFIFKPISPQWGPSYFENL